ncbi:MAG: UTP--glucose-1-phosphate uridylyltransferase [Eubacteriales bacterium]|nr:UTP--glucose-1-phosphate uridylyltransferase [Eubacteriales bacterium]
MSGKIRKAVIPAAGLGTRMLPATKTIPKELLPLVDRPILQYIVEEAVASGITEIILITSAGKSAMDNYFRQKPELEEKLRAMGREADAERVRRTWEMANFTFVQQDEQKGLGHAVWCARDAVGDEPFGVLLGDDVMYGGYPVLRQLTDAWEEYGLPAVATQAVDDEHIVKYSSLKMEPLKGRVMRVTDMNEKPTLEEKFSNYAILGRYVLTPEIFEILERTPPGRNNEIQLTDGLRELTLKSGMLGVEFEGRRYDTGNPCDYVETFAEYALRDAETGPGFRAWIMRKAEELREEKG